MSECGIAGQQTRKIIVVVVDTVKEITFEA